MSTPSGPSKPVKTARSTSNPGDEKRSTDPPGIVYDPAIERARKYNTDIPHLLPHERVFPIQIGSQLFRLSGASISSDGMYCNLLLLEDWTILSGNTHLESLRG